MHNITEHMDHWLTGPELPSKGQRHVLSYLSHASSSSYRSCELLSQLQQYACNLENLGFKELREGLLSLTEFTFDISFPS